MHRTVHSCSYDFTFFFPFFFQCSHFKVNQTPHPLLSHNYLNIFQWKYIYIYLYIKKWCNSINEVLSGASLWSGLESRIAWLYGLAKSRTRRSMPPTCIMQSNAYTITNIYIYIYTKQKTNYEISDFRSAHYRAPPINATLLKKQHVMNNV